MSTVLQMLLGGAADILPGLKPPARASGFAGFSVSQSESIATLPRTIVIGAPGYFQGAFFVYRFNGVGWSFLQTVLAPGLNTNFGEVVVISDDADKILIGAPLDQSQGRVHAYIWDVGTSNYKPESIIDPNAGTGPGPDALFGSSISMDKQGLSFVAGAPEGISSDAGTAYAFQYTAGWQAVIGQILPTAPQANSHFGTNLALSADGLQLVVTRPDATAPSPDIWWYTRVDVLTAFGGSSDDTNISGAALRDIVFDSAATLTFAISGNGAIFTYEDTAPGVWSLVGTDNPPVSGVDLLSFGDNIDANDQDLIVGAPGDAAGFGGSITLYTFTGGGVLTFVRTEYAPTDGEQLGAAFGFDVNVINSAPEMVIGQPLLDRGAAVDAGNVYSLPI